VSAIIICEASWPKLWIICRIHSMRLTMNGLTRAVRLFSLVVVGMSDHAEEFK